MVRLDELADASLLSHVRIAYTRVPSETIRPGNATECVNIRGLGGWSLSLRGTRLRGCMEDGRVVAAAATTASAEAEVEAEGLIFVRGCGNAQTGCRNRVGFYPRGLYPRNQLPDYSITAYQHGVCLI